jgi:hypothetical protein
MEKRSFHIIHLQGGCQCLRKVKLKDDSCPGRPIPLKKTSAVKAIVDEYAIYTLEEYVTYQSVICVFHFEKKVKVKDSMRPLDPAFTNISGLKKDRPY